MPNIHALRDEIVRNTTDLIINLHKLFKEDKESGKAAYEVAVGKLVGSFGQDDEDPVKEQSPMMA